ncbi:hypothetical protein [Streptomyces pacificus]|uniref:Uncharacterized protein n=1 Tax=Streptomyces pacificus TaxID=2705029 RepID=A0A6A0AP68_9ACTN|nr:hypothetical protein [Streptomyces pacificus]GFH34275.1 hypothetical protein SCWH03_04890 [Streptomyces pacificus]
MNVRAPQLPKLRDQTLRFLDDPQSALRSGTSSGIQPGLDALASQLRAADLYWVTEDMAALAVSAGSQLAAARWTVADRPSPIGLAMFDGGISTIDARGAQIPVEGVAWGPYDGECMVWLLLSRRRLIAEMTRTDIQLIEEETPPLIPVYGFTIPLTGEALPMAELDVGDCPLIVMQALAASWLLMQQPNLVERATLPADKTVARSYRRAQRPVPDVTLVDLRRHYVPDTAEPNGDGAGSRYRHRWVVSGHWRDQAHGPGRSLRRRTWVPTYVKGPDGAPLLVAEKVNVWRR